MTFTVPFPGRKFWIRVKICWIESSKLQGKNITAKRSAAARNVVLIAKRYKKISLFIAKLWPFMQVSNNFSHCSLSFNKAKKDLTWIYDCKPFYTASCSFQQSLSNPVFTSADKWQGSQNSIYFTATFNFFFRRFSLSWKSNSVFLKFVLKTEKKKCKQIKRRKRR